jgi:hypothetical protein
MLRAQLRGTRCYVALRTARRGSLFRLCSRLTQKGVDLLPVIVEIIVWSAKCDPDSPVSKALFRRATRDRKGLLAEMRARAASTQP